MRKFILLFTFVLIAIAPTMAKAQSITTGAVTGTITACAGSASMSPNLQEFTISATGISGFLTAVAPPNFEVAPAANGPFAPNVMLPTTNGTAAGTIYVRSAATAPLGSISGVVNISAPGALTQMLNVRGIINNIPSANLPGNITVANGQPVNQLNFTGSPRGTSWVNDRPDIGTPANGEGFIPQFIATNNSSTPITATINVKPFTDAVLYATDPGNTNINTVNLGNDKIRQFPATGGIHKPLVANNTSTKLYALNSASVQIIDPVTNQIIKTVPLSFLPRSIMISPDDKRVFVLSQFANYDAVAIIDGITDTLVRYINVGPTIPSSAMISNDGQHLYISMATGVTVSYNAQTYVAEKGIPSSIYPFFMHQSPDGKRLYINDQAYQGITVIDVPTWQNVTFIQLAGNVSTSILSPDGQWLYVLGGAGDTVYVISTSTNSITQVLSPGMGMVDMVMTPDGKYLYTLNQLSSSLSKVNLANFATDVIPFNAGYLTDASIAMHPDGSKVYVSTNNFYTVSVATNAILANAPGYIGAISNRSFVRQLPCEGPIQTFTITVNNSLASSPASISSSGSISNLQTTFGKSSPSQSFTITGTALTAGILVTPPSGFEVSSDNINFSPSVTVGTAGTVASTLVYVRLASITNANIYSGNIVLSSAGAANVNVPIANSTVLPVTLTITGGYPKTYGEQLSNYTLYYNDPYISFDDSKFVNGNTFYSVDISFMAGMAKTTPVGTYQNAVVLSALKGANGFLASNYDVHYDPLPLIVDPADLTITAKNVTKPFGQTKATETGSQDFSSSPLQNGETIGSVTINYGAGAAANATPGTYPGSVIPSAATGGTFDPHNYQIVYAPGNLIVSASTLPTITSTGVPAGVNTVFGTSSSPSSFNVSGTNLSGSILVTPPAGFEVSTNNITYSPTVTITGGATIPNTTIYIRLSSLTNAGTYNGDIVLSSAAATAIKVFMPDSKVDKATLQVQAPYVDKTYGEVLTSRNVGPDGFSFGGGTSLKNGNKIDVVTLTYGAGAAANADVRRYTGAITIAILSTSGNFLPDNYNIVFIPGYIEVTRAPLTIELNPVDKTYGSALTGGPGYTDFKVTGLKNQETVGSITVQYVKGAAANDPVGPYVASLVGSAVTGGTYKAANYQPARYISGTLTIKPATLTITADNKARRYLEENPPLSYTYSGFVNGENASIVSAAPTVSTTATVTSSVGKYPITLSRNAVAPNYKIDYVDALLSITRTGGMALKFPNTFTPNGDGVNDTWLLTDLEDYPNCVVKIYTRYGQEVFNSVGYSAPWAGTYKGANVPNGVYYYVIDPKDEGTMMSGSVTVIR